MDEDLQVIEVFLPEPSMQPAGTQEAAGTAGSEPAELAGGGMQPCVCERVQREGGHEEVVLLLLLKLT